MILKSVEDVSVSCRRCNVDMNFMSCMNFCESIFVCPVCDESVILRSKNRR